MLLLDTFARPEQDELVTRSREGEQREIEASEKVVSTPRLVALVPAVKPSTDHDAERLAGGKLRRLRMHERERFGGASLRGHAADDAAIVDHAHA